MLRSAWAAQSSFAQFRAVLAGAALSACLAACGQQGSDLGAVTTGAGPKPVDAEKEIAVLGAPATEQVKALYDTDFEATGSEPFWQLSLARDWVSFQRPGLQEVGGLPTRRDFRANGARIAAGPLVITLKNTECKRDSGETFPFIAEVDYEGVPYVGCARPGSASASAGWISDLPELIPAIDACLGKVDNKPARVALAYLLDNDQTASVRLLDAQGGRYECSVPAKGGTVTYWGALGDKDVMQGENDPIFTRAPTPAPAARNCTESEEAKTPDGHVVGWLTKKTC
jgi:uncharacterized membrane protein